MYGGMKGRAGLSRKTRPIKTFCGHLHVLTIWGLHIITSEGF